MNEYPDLDSIQHEVINDRSIPHHDCVFKLIIIGDTGALLLPHQAARLTPAQL